MFEVLAGAMLLLGLVTLMVLSGRIGLWWARRKQWPLVALVATSALAAIEWPFVLAWRYVRWHRTLGWLGVLLPEVSHPRGDASTDGPVTSNLAGRTGPNLGRPPTAEERTQLRRQLGRE